MRARTSQLTFACAETLLLLAVITPVTHMRALLLSLLVSNPASLPELGPTEPGFILLRSLLFVLVLQMAFGFRDLYSWSIIVRPETVVVRLVEAIILVLVALPLLHYGMGVVDRAMELDGLFLRLQIHPFLIVAGCGIAFLSGYTFRMRWPRWIHGAGLAERVLLVGRGPMADLIVEEARRRRDPGIELVGFLDEQGEQSLGRRVLGAPDGAEAVVRDHDIQRVVISVDAVPANDAMLRLRLAGARISSASAFYERITGRVSPAAIASPDLFLSTAGPGLAYRVASRLTDVFCAGIGLALALPLMLAAALAIKLESRGPIFYSQERMGLNGRSFRVSKFRSMRADAEVGTGPVWAQANDNRITRVGRWLRKLRVDEIPQLWAVLRNDMSLVGPRPERPFFVDELTKQIPHYGRRHLVKPGVTGWAQINHSYGNTTDDAFIKLQLDLYYVKHRSLALDIAIILRTVKVVVLQQGAV
ncbi:MAG: sugar transferase [Planctomycetota bacterium]|nr:MAG: sugar transferase [Planctomycetota bacterium]